MSEKRRDSEGSLLASQGVERQSDQFRVSSRRIVAESADIQVKEFLLTVEEEVPWHHHTEVFDLFYCLEGTLKVQRSDVFSNERLEDLVLQVGESVKVEPGTAHRPVNEGPGVCRFLLIQGVGKYDFLPYEGQAGQA